MGDLGDDALEVLKIATELFHQAEMNAKLRDTNNPVNSTTNVLGQKMITKEEEKRLRFLRGRDVSRSLIEYHTLTGSEREIGLEALFDREPAPHTDEVNALFPFAINIVRPGPASVSPRLERLPRRTSSSIVESTDCSRIGLVQFVSQNTHCISRLYLYATEVRPCHKNMSTHRVERLYAK
jgi:hypothetical protein